MSGTSGRAPSDRGGDPSTLSDPSPHLQPPMAPPGAAEADPQPQPAAPTSELPEVMHRTRAVDFFGRRTVIVYQNDDGPSPLVATCNYMLLKDMVNLDPDSLEVSQKRLLSLVAKGLMDSGDAMQERDQDKEHICRRWDDIREALEILSHLTIARKIDDFELTREHGIFDLLDIPLYHEVDLTMSNKTESQKRRGDREEEEELMRALNLSKAERGREHADAHTSQAAETEVTCDSLVAACEAAPDHAKTGLFCSQEGVNKGELCVLFDNNHFNIMLKYNGDLYLLATDESSINQTDSVWKKLDEDFNSQIDNSTSGKNQVLQLVNEHADGCTSSNIHILHPCGGMEKKIYTLPENLYEILKPHQKKGLDWLWKVHCKGSGGGLIADDMGLGKTLQVTIFLAGLFHSNIIERVMIIAPLNVLNSWTKELKRSGLERRVQDYYDSGDRGLRVIQEEGGILLLPYTMYESRHELLIGLPSLKWDYVILDEAHKIKNPGADITKSMNKLKCKKKLLLTGTPIMRDLMDLFSLLNFMDPKILGSEKQFHKNYMKPVLLGQYSNSTKDEKEECLKALARLWRKTSPHILRRTKNVLIESGELRCKKHDILIWLGLTPLQALLNRKLSKLFGPQLQNKSVTGMMLCQRICNDPALVLQVRDGGGPIIKEMAKKLLGLMKVDETYYRDIQHSCKLSFILYLVENLFDEEKLNKDLFEQNKKEDLVQWKKLKILIFSQHIEMLIRIRSMIQHIVPKGDIIQMDGSTKKEDRDLIIENFNSSEGPTILLLSAKVGGEGLNLTAATRVIIVDPSWNLSDDNQISDRVYRIGQQEDVVIYRLFTCNTVEEHAYKLQAAIDGKFCTPLAKKEDEKIMKIEGGFNSSRTLELIKRLIGDKLELDMKHQMFLRKHKHVVGITDQSAVFSKMMASMKDVHCEDSDEDAATVSNEDHSWNMQLRNRHPLGDSDASMHKFGTRKMEIPANKAGVLRGKNWETIKRIGLQTSSVIHIIDRDKPDPNSPFKCVEISGDLKGYLEAKMLILDTIAKVEEVMTYVPVPIDQVGLILGRQFKNLKSMQQDSGVASIEYVKNGNMLRIVGVEEAVEKAKALVLEKVSQARHQEWVPPGPPRPGYTVDPQRNHGVQHHGLLPAAQQRPGCIVHQPPHPGPPGHGVQAPPHQGPPAQSHGGNGEENWNRGNLAYPQAPGTYPGHMYSSCRDGTLQPAFGNDGRKVKAQGNVLLASIENMQYAVTVDVLHTVFSSFGTVQKIDIFEKSGGTQAFIQYPDVNTAAVAKEALEGHCIYDGGYCKLHLSYSCHTDLNVKAHGDKSRDYTIPAGLIQGVPQPPRHGNLQAAVAYAPPGGPAQSHGTIGQMQNWNPGNSMYPPAPASYPSQIYSSPLQYATTSGGFPNTPTGARPQQLHASRQMPPPQHENQSRGPPQPPPPSSYYR